VTGSPPRAAAARVAALDGFWSGPFTTGGGEAFPDGEIGRPLLSSCTGDGGSAAPNFSDFGIGSTALTGTFGSAEASAKPLGSSLGAFAALVVSAGMNLGLVGRDEAARLAAEAGGGVEPDADDFGDGRTGEVRETVTGSWELSKTDEPFSSAPEPFA
jgi:hypothetical protein